LTALRRITSAAVLAAGGFVVQAMAAAPGPSDSTDALQEVIVTAVRQRMIGQAETSSQGVVVKDELELLPAYRPGQLLETVPGLVVTSHSGEGKANQYLLRGFNLDHGTDLALFVDEMPINQRTHAHGQGYSDVNFLIPELAAGLTFSKGPYFASVGDFGSVGAIHTQIAVRIDDQLDLTAGTLGYQRLFGSGSGAAAGGQILGAAELVHYDGPWTNPDDQRKANAVLRYVRGTAEEGFSLTGMFYRSTWNATTDQPQRAITDGLIGRYGTLDPTDGGDAARASLSGQYHHRVWDGELSASAYAIDSHLTLWNDFTHFLIDPVNGDQEAQHEERRTLGGAVRFLVASGFLGVPSEFELGLDTRWDVIDGLRIPTRARVALTASASPASFTESDYVHEAGAGVYAELTTHWSSRFRTVLGLREDYLHESDSGTNAGSDGAALTQPKASLIFTPAEATELYLSAGRGFHSDDARGVNQARVTGQSGAPLIAASKGAELGLRQQFGPTLSATLTYFLIDFQSETTYDPDVGQDSAGPGSRRRGIELNLTYQPLRWLELYATVAKTSAHFTAPYDDGTGHIGEYIPNAPDVIASLALYVKDRGPWSGGLEYRFLGRQPLTPDNAVTGGQYGEWNGDARWQFADKWNVTLGLYNILNTHTAAAAFWYVDRLPGEPAEGTADLHTHPLEPFTARLTVGKTF